MTQSASSQLKNFHGASECLQEFSVLVCRCRLCVLQKMHKISKMREKTVLMYCIILTVHEKVNNNSEADCVARALMVA